MNGCEFGCMIDRAAEVCVCMLFEFRQIQSFDGTTDFDFFFN